MSQWMNRFTFLLATATLSLQAYATEQQTLSCSVGPLKKIYGKAEWIVYSCNDLSTVIFVSAPGNAASPFLFTLYKKEGSYHLHGEGTGQKKITSAVFTELQALTENDISGLIAQTRNLKIKEESQGGTSAP